MKQVRLNSPRVMRWRVYLVLTVLDHFRVGANITISPVDVSAWLNLPWFEVGIGVENNPY